MADMAEVLQKATDLSERAIAAGEVAVALVQCQHDAIVQLVELAIGAGADPDAVREVLRAIGKRQS